MARNTYSFYPFPDPYEHEFPREKMGELTEKIETIEKDKRTRLVQEQYQKDKTKLDKLRLQIAKRNYAISALQRQVDDIPTRIELLQYQKRWGGLVIGLV